MMNNSCRELIGLLNRQLLEFKPNLISHWRHKSMQRSSVRCIDLWRHPFEGTLQGTHEQPWANRAVYR